MSGQYRTTSFVEGSSYRTSSYSVQVLDVRNHICNSLWNKIRYRGKEIISVSCFRGFSKSIACLLVTTRRMHSQEQPEAQGEREARETSKEEQKAKRPQAARIALLSRWYVNVQLELTRLPFRLRQLPLTCPKTSLPHTCI